MFVSSVEFDIQYPDGRSESLVVPGDRMLIGSGGHCEVRLAAECAASEQAVVEVLAGTIRVAARTMTPRLVVDGRRMDDGMMVVGSHLQFGEVTIRLSLLATDASVGAGTGPRAAHGRRNLAPVVGLGFLVVVAAVGLLWLGSQAAPPPPRIPPSLWSDTSAACPSLERTEAAATATRKVTLAEARAERHPFHLAEGVEAVELYRVASACFRSAGEDQEAHAATEAADQLRARIDLDYRVRSLRLDYALARSDAPTVGAEVVMLRQLLAGRTGPYVDWLDRLARSTPKEKEESE